LLLSTFFQVFAASDTPQKTKYKIYIDNKLTTFNSQLMTKSKKLMLPLEEFLISIGISKENIEYRYYEDKLICIDIFYKASIFSLDLDGNYVWASNGKGVTLDERPLLYNNKVYIPIESFVKLFDKKAVINNAKSTVNISDNVHLEPKGWVRLKDRPIGNESVNIKMKSVIPGIGGVSFQTDNQYKAVSIDGKIYMIDNNGTLKEYDPKTDIWSDKTKINEVKDSQGVYKLAVLNNKILIIGVNYSDIFQYDVATKECKLLTKLPTNIVVGSVVVAEGKLYILSGMGVGDPNTLNSLEMYDPETDKWTEKGDMFEGSNNLTSIYYNGKIYIFGAVKGTDLDDHSYPGQNIEAYDIKTDTWSYISPDDVYWFASGLEVSNNKLYVFGDGSDKKSNSTKYSVKLFEPDNNKWTVVADMLPKDSGYSTCTINGDIYVIDGKIVEKFTPANMR
jgi:hypothetical protein